jgi:4a-hydroxytetrahydrobiopterin dehydratase
MSHWKEENNKLKAEFEFSNFIEAFAFMTKVAIHAEKLNHHPTMTNTYNRVSFELSTHDAGDVVTELDHKLAGRISEAYQKD